MSKLISAVNEIAMDAVDSASEIVTEMPFGEVLLKSILAYASIFLVTGVIILSIVVLNRLTSKKK
jgi:quinol-cytochrome oxidoreductase complex cytochrome b subunit